MRGGKNTFSVSFSNPSSMYIDIFNMIMIIKDLPFFSYPLPLYVNVAAQLTKLFLMATEYSVSQYLSGTHGHSLLTSVPEKGFLNIKPLLKYPNPVCL